MCFMRALQRRPQMENRRKYHVIVGSKAFFDTSLPAFSEQDNVNTFLEMVKLSDVAKQNHMIFEEQVDILIVKNNNYHGIVEAAHDRLGPLIEDLTTVDAEIYVHNPPRILKEYLDDQHARLLIDLDIVCEQYEFVRDNEKFAEKMNRISSHILGQQNAIEEMGKSLWYLTSVRRTKPYVIMLYGKSSLGKTELVREIAKEFYNDKFLEKHLSMFKNNNYSEYFFGDAPNRRSLGFDLLERESNLVFFDELDKCPEHFFSAFYTLFDNVEFKDATYDANVAGVVIVLTSNYNTEEEMQKQLGFPIYYRIDKFIHFNDFDCDTIYNIVQNEIMVRKPEYEDKITPDMVYAAVSRQIAVTGENARTIKYKVQRVIEELFFQEVKEKINH